MTPNAEDCETAKLNEDYNVPIHQGHKVLPERTTPAQAWTEVEEGSGKGPGDSRRLLPYSSSLHPHKSLQAGVTLGVHSNYPQKPLTSKLQKTRFQKRKEKLIEALKPPYYILSMIIIMACVHLFGTDEFRGWLEWKPHSWKLEEWRMFTYGVVHANHAHFALNALVALIVGWRLEREQGWWRVLCVWWGGVASGAVGASLLQPDVKVVGASAAVYALLTAHLPNVWLRFGHIPLWWFRPLSVVVLCASEGGWALAQGHGLASLGGAGEGGAGEGHSLPHVAWAAHLLGALVGVPLGFIVFTGENNKKTSLMVARILSAWCLVTATVLVVVYYIMYDET